MINTDGFYSPPSISILCAPCIIFTFYLHELFSWHYLILLVLIFIVNWNFKLLNLHSILLLLRAIAILLAIFFAILLSNNYCCIVVIYLLLLLFTHLFTDLFIFTVSSIYLFCGLDFYKVQPFKSSPHIRFTAVYIAYL